MNVLEREFLRASIEVNEREAAEREAQYQRELDHAKKLAEVERQRAEENKMTARQLRRRSMFLAGAFGMAVVLLFIAGLLGWQAQNARLVATSRELAAASISNLELDPERSILLATRALNIHYTIEAEEALHRALQASRVQLVLQTHEAGAPASVAFSPDGKHIITASTDERAKVFEVAMGKLLFRYV
jgi:hypothetical protein